MSSATERIQKYFDGNSQYPLLVVVSPNEYSEVLDTFGSVSRITLSSYCVGEDKEPDMVKLLEDVKSKSGRYLLLGLGDYLANKGDNAKKILYQYKDLVLKENCRIAMVLSLHMYLLTKKLMDSDPRVRSRIVLTKSAQSAEEVSGKDLVYGIKAFLEACEKGVSVDSVISRRQIQNVKVINPEKAFDELKHKFPNEFTKLKECNGTSENWRQMLDSINETGSNIKQYLSEQDFAAIEFIFLDNAKSSDYKAWLFLIYIKLSTTTKNYIGFVATNADTQDNLLDVAKTAILDIPVTDERFAGFYEQRKRMLQGCNDVDMADYIPKVTIKEVDRIAYLTDNTKIERKAVIEALCNGADDRYVEGSYPNLYLYLQDFLLEDERFTDYFRVYKKNKLTNRIDSQFMSVVNDYATSRPYNSVPARSATMSSLDDGDTLLLFLDAFGVEYLGYVKGICAQLKLRLSAKVARANLPTVTSKNNQFYNEWRGKKENPVKPIDNSKHHAEVSYHHSNSPYPIHIVDELEAVKTALEEMKIRLSTGVCKRVVIASDHGASRLAVISAEVKIPNNGCEVKSNGRYCVGNDLPTGDSIVEELDGGYAVIANYSRFEGSRAATVETHGGATLEEILVPVIELVLSDSNIEVALEQSVIEVGYKTVPTLVFIVSLDCDDITASIGGKFYEVKMIDKNKFAVEMPDLKKGHYVLNIFENQNEIGVKEFTIKSKGVTQRELF